LATLRTFVTRDKATIRDAFLRVIRNGLIARGVPNPNVTPGSDYYVLGEAIGQQLEVVEANAPIKADAAMPDTAVDDPGSDSAELSRIAGFFKLSKQPAAGAAGPGILNSSAPTVVVTGAQLLDSTGQIFEVVTGGVVANGATLDIRAIIAVGQTTGQSTNHAEGDVLRWVSRPPFCDEKVLVGPGGLVNGHDEDDNEALRARLFARLQNPPRSGNTQHVAEMAYESNPAVKGAYVYPALQGAGTVHVAVAASPTDSSLQRDVDATTMSTTVAPYVQGQYPGHAYVVVTTVANVAADVAFGLSIPEAATASPPGPGGGWINGSAWPSVDALTAWRVTVTAVTSSSVFTVDAATAPQQNVSRIAWWNATTLRLYTARVISATAITGAYVITIDQPFVGIAVGEYIWPECVNAQAYVDATLAAFARMGPGEKTGNASVGARGFRHPRPATSAPYALSAHLCRSLTDAQQEVQSAQFLHRTDGAVTLTGAAGSIAPQALAAINIESPPNIYVPRRIAFYRIPS
jgi:uncharacterized phage protein gp47/JayE